jgi:signal transduction histidine kinase
MTVAETTTQVHQDAPHRRVRFGLRLRVTIAFGLVSLVVVLAFSFTTYFLAQRYLVQQRERSATRQAFLDARLVRDAILASSADPNEALNLLELSPRSQAVFSRDGQWFGEGVAIGPDTLPPEFVAVVARGSAAHQRVELLGERRLLVGVPVPAVDGIYVEAFSLAELSATLRVIRNVLLVGTILTPLAMGALGLWASERVLRPVGAVSDAAAQIAGGDLGARLEPQADPDLERMADSFNQMVEALAERMERDARFASDVSHELRSPLTTLAAAASVLDARRDDLPERGRQAVDLVAHEITRFRSLVEDLLELSRLQAGADALQPEPVRLGELVLHVVARTADESVVVDIDPELDAVLTVTDKRRIERILVNLVQNAHEHAGGAVRVGAARTASLVRLAVEDAGPGVRAEDREAIFARFARGRRAGSRGDSLGSGLGLALVAEHVRLLGGRVWVEDRAPLPGTRFVVEFPVELE